MVIKSVTVAHLRCHEHSRIDCATDITVLAGPNGSGKTSMLEAISICAIGTTFVPVQDSSLIMSGRPACTASVEATSDVDIPYRVGVEIREGVRKKISSTHGSNITAKDLIGELPIVALSPDHKSITFGGPSERRSYLDRVMAQCSRRYRDLLYEHRRVLKHRNALLSRHEWNELVVWSDKFIELGAEIIERRYQFLNELIPAVRDEYSIVSEKKELIDMNYQPDGVPSEMIGTNRTALADILREQWHRVADRERVRETTLFGPQKDEVEIVINERPVRDTASQGQHKSLLIALKLAECRKLLEQRNERPVVLFDDVFSELDFDRSAQVLNRILHLRMQSFITTTDGSRLLERIDKHVNTSVSVFVVDKGQVELNSAIGAARSEAA
jgi:DNA replication and repair protein RecF